jgi:hypothetical protein
MLISRLSRKGSRPESTAREPRNATSPVRPEPVARFFARLVDTSLEQANNRGGRVGDADCCLLDSLGLLELALRVMKAVAANPGPADSLHP